MKKLYQGKGRRVHPAPADAAAVALPAAVLALASALTTEEQEVLAYLLSSSSSGGDAAGCRPRRRCRGPHPPEMGCACFGCYKSFWARWDASPNRHLIHRIIDAVEEGGGGAATSRRRRRGRRNGDAAATEADDVGVGHHHPDRCDDGDGEQEDVVERGTSMDGDGDEDSLTDNRGTAEKSSVGRLVRFIGEKVWGTWN